MSFSLMPPTPRCTTWIRTSLCGILSSASTIASSEPCTSALMIRFRTGISPSRARTRSSESEDAGRVAVSSAARIRASRSWATCRASRSSATVRNSSPASGTCDHPRTCTGIDGPASVTDFPFSSSIARTFANAAPHTTASPT